MYTFLGHIFSLLHHIDLTTSPPSFLPTHQLPPAVRRASSTPWPMHTVRVVSSLILFYQSPTRGTGSSGSDCCSNPMAIFTARKILTQRTEVKIKQNRANGGHSFNFPQNIELRPGLSFYPPTTFSLITTHI